MTKFINNLNKYLSEMKIKQNCLSMLTGIDKNKLSRLLTGVQDESGTDMEKIAQALGKDVEFFLKDSISIPEINHFTLNKIAFYAGEPSKKQERIANQLMELMENIDEVISAKSRFENKQRIRKKMNIERLRKIIQYSKENRQETNSMIKIFCFFRGIEYDNSLLDILQIARSSFRKKGFLVFQMPFADDEIGALSYRGDGIGYVVINQWRKPIIL